MLGVWFSNSVRYNYAHSLSGPVDRRRVVAPSKTCGHQSSAILQASLALSSVSSSVSCIHARRGRPRHSGLLSGLPPARVSTVVQSGLVSLPLASVGARQRVASESYALKTENVVIEKSRTCIHFASTHPFFGPIIIIVIPPSGIKRNDRIVSCHFAAADLTDVASSRLMESALRQYAVVYCILGVASLSRRR